jgi:hypothetical protein
MSYIDDKDIIFDDDEKKTKISAENVADAFQYFVEIYEKFREDNGLSNTPKVVLASKRFEMCAALMDKGGRIARQIKHMEKNDPKPDWPEGMTEAMTGFIIYMLLILDSYNLKMRNGMVKELKSALKQYGDKQC